MAVAGSTAGTAAATTSHAPTEPKSVPQPEAEGGPAGEPADTVTEPGIETPAPTGTVVLAVGDQLFAVEAEDYIKGRLAQAGVEIVEVTSIPGLEGFVNTEARPNPEQVRVVLRPFARFLVGVRVEYLGDRAIYYMGQRDVAHQARVHLSLVDLEAGRPVGQPHNVRVEFTPLNARDVASKELRQPMTALLQILPRD
jgi:hypothetical protein